MRAGSRSAVTLRFAQEGRWGPNLLLLATILASSSAVPAQEDRAQVDEIRFPVTATVLVEDKFVRCEGIAFSGEGDLYVSGNQSLWRVSTTGEVTKIAELYTNLGLAPIGERDILMADFGPTNRFNHGPNDDGIVWRITPEGDKTRIVDGGIGDPNFVLVRDDGSLLVSDDATDEIFLVDAEGAVTLFTDSIGHPNGMVLSADRSTLYVAQIFTSLRPLVVDDRVWALPLKDGAIAGEPKVIARLGEKAANDGLAMDELGRIYVASNGQGKIWRVDPATGETVLIAENMPGVASLAFGEGEFDHHAIYATSTRTGKVWEVKIGVGGSPVIDSP
jgi:sugar lactone lactonase YvrE